MKFRTCRALAGAAAWVLSLSCAHAQKYPDQMVGKAAIACNFEADLVFGRKIDLASKYVTDDFVEHNAQAAATSRQQFQDMLSKMPRFPGPPSGCGSAKIVLIEGDYVTFIREAQRPDPAHPGKQISVTTFNVWRFEGNKIAEHWD